MANPQLNADGYIVVSDGHVLQDPKHYLRPISMSQLEGDPNLGQTPGW